jgi:GT2 family glycosyltransferase
MLPQLLESPREDAIAVIIVSYNGRHYLEGCLHSLKGQTHRNFRVMIVDNGSRDGSVAWLREHHPDVLVLPQKRNLGFSRANNILMKKAMAEGFEYMVLLNQDTVVQDNFLAEGIEQLKQGAGIACPKILFAQDRRIFFAGSQFIDDYWSLLRNNLLSVIVDPTAGEVDSPAFDEPKAVGFASGSAFFVSRIVIEAIGYLDERYFFNWETKDYSKMARDAGFTIMYFPSTVVLHDSPRLRSTSRIVKKYLFSKTGLWMAKGLFQFVAKHFGFFPMILFAVKTVLSVPFVYLWYLRNLKSKA